jgi:hypothetical protein
MVHGNEMMAIELGGYRQPKPSSHGPEQSYVGRICIFERRDADCYAFDRDSLQLDQRLSSL